MPEAPTPTANPPSQTATPVPSINQPFKDLDAAFERQFGLELNPEPNKLNPEPNKLNPEPNREAAPKVPPSKPASGVKDQSKEKVTEKQQDSGKTEKPATTASKNTATDKPLPAPELRKAYEELKAKHKALEAEHQAAKSKPPSEDTEKKELLTRTEQLAKRAQELEEKLRFANYEETEEYKTKYYKPYADAYLTGRAKAVSFKVTDADGNVRQATAGDFDRIMLTQDESQAVELAKEMYGDAAPLILWHREHILSQNQNRLNALDEFKKTAGERSKAEFETRQKKAKELEEKFHQYNKKAREFGWFKEVEGDDDGNALLKKGYERYEAIFNGGKMKDGERVIDLTEEQLVGLHSEALNKAAGFNRLHRNWKKAEERIAELEKELEQYKNSEPKAGEGDGEQKEPESAMDSAYNALNKLAMR